MRTKFSLVTFFIVLALGFAAASAIATGGMIVSQVIAQPAADIPPPPATPGDQPAPVVKPSDSLDNPATSPFEAWSDLKAAKKVGWPAALFAAVTMLCLALGTIGKSIKQLAWLGKGRWAVIVGGVAACGAAGFDAAMGGGSVIALLLAVWTAFLAYWNSQREAA